MKFKIHFERSDGSEDSIIVSGDTVEEIRQQAEVEVEVRNGLNPWGEPVQP